MSEPLRATRMSGAGNDFLVLGPESIGRLGDELISWARAVCRRGISLGADGVLCVEPAGAGRARVRFVNPDGSSAFCGNGSRCAARYAYREGYTEADSILLTDSGEVPARVRGETVSLTLPVPEDRGTLTVEAAGRRFEGRFVVAGIPHFVCEVADPSSVPLHAWGAALRRHRAFGESGTNVDFVARADGALRLRTFERGVEAETLCCGSGAVAAAFALRAEGAGPVRVVPASGIPLVVAFSGPRSSPNAASLEGEARFVAEIRVDPEAGRWGG